MDGCAIAYEGRERERERERERREELDQYQTENDNTAHFIQYAFFALSVYNYTTLWRASATRSGVGRNGSAKASWIAASRAAMRAAWRAASLAASLAAPTAGWALANFDLYSLRIEI
jgi:hypothetical protein